MLVVKNKAKLIHYLQKNKTSIGFTPTMGALHDGHISLIKKSKKRCDISVCSIFVNPTQFNKKEDFVSYPVSTNQDLELLKEIDCDIVYLPESEDLYKKNEKIKKYDYAELTNSLEGRFRNRHFDGVITVVKKFFEIIQPTHAFFGEKDLQQLQIIKKFVEKNHLPIKIISGKTIREKNGLAMSSRNRLLSIEEKNTAALLRKSLIYCKRNIRKESILTMKNKIENEFKKCSCLSLEYLEFVSLENFKKVVSFGEKNENAICIAAHLNNVRLIDNIIL